MSGRSRGGSRRVGWVGAIGLVLAGCGASGAQPADPGARADHQVAAAEPAAGIGEVAPAAPVARPSSGVDARPARRALDQPAIWPAPDVVFATPEEAAADFVSSVLISEGDPALGEFRAGDARSGEIAVLFAGETGDLDPPLEMGVLLVRQIGPTDGWYVIAATSPGARIDTPSAAQQVPAGTVTVAGEGRGFEGTLRVSAWPPGDRAATLDAQLGRGGPLGDLEPYSVELDLSGAADGDVVVILVHGDSGLGSDPSTFAALPVVIGATATPTIPETK